MLTTVPSVWDSTEGPRGCNEGGKINIIYKDPKER